MRHRTSYTSPATGRTTNRIVGVTNGTGAVSLVISTDHSGAPDQRVSAALDADDAVRIATDLIAHAVNLAAGVHGNQHEALDLSRTDAASQWLASAVQDLHLSHASRLADRAAAARVEPRA